MKFKVVFLILISIFLFACEPKEDIKDIDIFSENLFVYAENNSQDNVTKDFTLVTEIKGIKINWESSNEEVIQVIKERAIVTRGNKDELITLTASYNVKEEIKRKNFLIVVLGKNTSENDITPPVISGISNMEIALGTNINLLANVSAIDAVDGPVNVSIKENNLDINKEGTYKVVFEAVDKAGNFSTLEIQITVVKFKDTNAPVISGISNMEITIGTEVDLLSLVHAVDEVDGPVSVTIKESNLNVNNKGTYKVVFKAEDAAGNVAIFEITVEVVEVEEKKTYTEDFSKLTINTAAYTAGSFVGNHGLIWEFSGSRGDLPLNDKALTFGGKTEDYSSIKTVLSGGISYFSVDLKKAYENNFPRILALLVNDDIVAEFSVDLANTDIQVFEVELDVFGEYSLEIAQIDTTSNRAQVTLDNIVIINNPRSSLSIEEQNLNKDFDNLLVQNSFIEVGNITLPTTGVFGSLISWKYTDTASLNNNLINLTTGAVTMPNSGIVEVKIDAVIKNGEHQKIKTFTIKVGEGNPILISDVYNSVDNQKVKISGIVSNVFETANGKRFFIQDNSKGILVYLTNSTSVNVGDEVELIGQKKTTNSVIYVDNISKLNVLSTKTLSPISLTNQTLSNLAGKLVNLNGLLKFSYGNVNTFTLVNEHGEFYVYIDEALINSSSLKSKISGKATGIEVDLFGVIYIHDGEYKVYVTTLSDLEVEDVVNLSKIDAVIHSNLEFPVSGTNVTKNLSLFTQNDLFVDLRIEWTSNNTNVLTNQGLIYPGDNDTNVVLTYKIFINNNLVSTHNINLIISKKSSYTGYYSRIQGLSGAALKSELNSIVSNMKNISYTNTSYVLEDADEYNKTGQLLLIYSRTFAKNVWDGAKSWNKEHIWPQSKLGTASKSDLHNLRASNVSVNSSRGNSPYAEGSGKYGNVSGGWYPGDLDKGDVARIVLYMNLRWNLQISKSVIGDLQMFLRWHIEDPVDDFEIQRNQIIFDNQNNRNPFIDHPELVEMIFGKVTMSLSNEIETETQELYLMSFVFNDIINLPKRWAI